MEDYYTVKKDKVKYVIKTLFDEIDKEIGEKEKTNIEYVNAVEKKFFKLFNKNEEDEYEFTLKEITKFIYDILLEEESDLTLELLKSQDVDLIVDKDGNMYFEIN